MKLCDMVAKESQNLDYDSKKKFEQLQCSDFISQRRNVLKW